MSYFLFAIFFMIAGHMAKSLRWQRIISIYEKVPADRLLYSMSLGQTINMICPYRIGDIFRVWYTGKNLNNGYILSLATVAVDMLIDLITVGFAFAILIFLNLDQNSTIGLNYILLSVLALILCVVVYLCKQKIKKFIGKISAVFNEKIERRILMVSYTIFCSSKEIIRKHQLIWIGMSTVLIWLCYFLSYSCFAAFLTHIGFKFNVTSVFKTIFSMSGKAFVIETLQKGNTKFLMWFAFYLFIPLMLILFVTIIYHSVCKDKNKMPTSRRILPQVNENDKLAFLNIYFNGGDRNYFDSYLSLNSNVNVLRDCSAGSNATTILAMDSKDTFFRKYAFGKDAEKLSQQIIWLNQHSTELPVCKILRYNMQNEICYYDMEYKNGTVDFFHYIHTATQEESWGILKDVLVTLNTCLYDKTSYKQQDKTLKKYIQEKILDNFEHCLQWLKKYYPDIYDAQYCVVNGIKVKNLKLYSDLFDFKNLTMIFKNDKYAEIHGDLTIENIIYVSDCTPSWYLIDSNSGSMHESPFLDYAKLLQSLHGKYEFLMMVKDVKVTGNSVNYFFTGSAAYQMLYENFKEYLFRTFTKDEVKSIYYHEIVHWLRLMPYKIKKDPKGAIVFYCGMLNILNDIETIF